MKFNKLLSSIMLFAVFLFLSMLAVHKEAYAANAASGADTGSIESGTNANIKKIEKKLDKALFAFLIA